MKSTNARLIGLSLGLFASAMPVFAASPIIVAVPDFGFSDSSGEPKDQDAQHVARLRQVVEELRANISRDDAISSVAITCTSLPCPLTQHEVALLRDEAREAGASLIVLSSVHKVSTLVLSMKVDVFEVESGRVVTSKLLSFRGDNDEGWRRAGRFVARDVTDAMIGSVSPGSK